jgi:hypothetical protein
LWIVLLCAAGAMAFSRGYPPTVLNNTSGVVDVTARLGGHTAAFSLAPHTNFVEGTPNLRLAELSIRYASGRTLKFTSDQLDTIRRRTPVANELWVIRLAGVDLFDSREWRRFQIR